LYIATNHASLHEITLHYRSVRRLSRTKRKWMWFIRKRRRRREREKKRER